MWPWGILGLGILAAIALALFFWRMSQLAPDQHAVESFRHRREQLEAKFFDCAAALGKPRGLRWTHCEWKPEVRFARDLETGLLTAFSAVEIHFEAIPGGEMEDVEAVGHFREASAVFHYQNGNWGTGGKALFNMTPDMAVERLAGQYEPLEIETGSPSASPR